MSAWCSVEQLLILHQQVVGLAELAADGLVSLDLGRLLVPGLDDGTRDHFRISAGLDGDVACFLFPVQLAKIEPRNRSCDGCRKRSGARTLGNRVGQGHGQEGGDGEGLEDSVTKHFDLGMSVISRKDFRISLLK